MQRDIAEICLCGMDAARAINWEEHLKSKVR